MDTSPAQHSPFGENIRKFVSLEAAAGLVLLAAAVLAMLVKNSPLSETYQALLLLEGEVRLGGLKLEKPLFIWVNDLWMAVFFFLVTMEIKREAIEGYLSDPKADRAASSCRCGRYHRSSGNLCGGQLG